MPIQYALPRDEMNKRAIVQKDKLFLVKEKFDCKVCDRRHKEKACKYICKYFKMIGSHKAEKCFQQFPHLRKKERSQ